MLTRRSGDEDGDVPTHVAAVLGGDAEPSKVRGFYVWCEELGVETATVCLPDVVNRAPYDDAVADLDPPVCVVDGPDGDVDDAERVLSYLGGREEVVEAFRRLARDVDEGGLEADDIDDAVVEERLAVPGEPDLFVDVSDDVLSDVLVWQTVYSELCYVDELTEDVLRRCVEDYAERERRYGR